MSRRGATRSSGSRRFCTAGSRVPLLGPQEAAEGRKARSTVLAGGARGALRTQGSPPVVHQTVAQLGDLDARSPARANASAPGDHLGLRAGKFVTRRVAGTKSRSGARVE